ncbi:helix-turn-helix domain-containing protein [Microbacterium sp. RURRCA19A]|uniref:helix-turn-helix domain-containing protein n=1 Tax=Microbacterium sp. RURRCA19A TaxID=1907391 RepID=UPI000954155D|nr:helix-turn-helix domain-containing protein [Microbacterium sp. RURRCA19A]SIR56189.1 DNA binding domain-containing protein, excisionase family [Microbacterium sp. RURRCA19A]
MRTGDSLHKPNWASIQTVAEYLDVSDDTIRRMIARGDIPARRFGPRLIRIDMNLLEAAREPVVLTEDQA